MPIQQNPLWKQENLASFFKTIRAIETFSNPDKPGQIISGLVKNDYPNTDYTVNPNNGTSGTRGASTYPGDQRPTPGSYQVDLINIDQKYATWSAANPKEIYFTKSALSNFFKIEIDSSGNITSIGKEAASVFLDNISIATDANFNSTQNVLIGRNINEFGREQLSLYLAGRSPEDANLGGSDLLPNTRVVPDNVLAMAEYAQEMVARRFVVEFYNQSYVSNPNNGIYGTGGWANVEALFGSKLIFTSTNSAFGVNAGDKFFGTLNKEFFAGVMYVKGPYGDEGRGFAKALIEAHKTIGGLGTKIGESGATVIWDGEAFTIDKTLANVNATYPSGWHYGALLSAYETPSMTAIEWGYPSDVFNMGYTPPTFYSATSTQSENIITVLPAGESSANSYQKYTYSDLSDKTLKVSGDEKYIITSSGLAASTPSSANVVVNTSGYLATPNHTQKLPVGGKINMSSFNTTFEAAKNKFVYAYWSNSVQTVKAVDDPSIPANQALNLYYVKTATSVEDAIQKVSAGTDGDFGFRVEVANKDVLGTLDESDFIFTAPIPPSSSSLATIDASLSTGSLRIDVDSGISKVKLGSGTAVIEDVNTAQTTYVINPNMPTFKDAVFIRGFDRYSDKIDLSAFSDVSNLTITYDAFDTKSDLPGSSAAEFYKNYSYSARISFDAMKNGAKSQYSIMIGIESDGDLSVDSDRNGRADLIDGIRKGIIGGNLPSDPTSDPGNVIDNPTPVNNPPTAANYINNAVQELQNESSQTQIVIADNLKTNLNAQDPDGNTLTFSLKDANGAKVTSITKAEGTYKIIETGGVYKLILEPVDANFSTSAQKSLDIIVSDGTNNITQTVNFAIIDDNSDLSVINLVNLSPSVAVNSGIVNISTSQGGTSDVVLKIGEVKDADVLYGNGDYSTSTVKLYDKNGVLLVNPNISASVSSNGDIQLIVNKLYYNTTPLELKYSVVDSTGLESAKKDATLSVAKVSSSVTLTKADLATFNEDDSVLTADDGVKVASFTLNDVNNASPTVSQFKIINENSNPVEIYTIKQDAAGGNNFSVYARFPANYNSEQNGASLNRNLDLNLRVEYDGSRSALLTNQVLIKSVNDAPQIGNTANLVFNEDLTGIFDIKQFVSDVEDQSSGLQLSILNVKDSQGNINNSINASFNQAGQLVLNPAANWNGSGTLDLKVTDSAGASTVKTLNFTVNPVADKPIVSVVSNIYRFINNTSGVTEFNINDIDSLVVQADGSGYSLRSGSYAIMQDGVDNTSGFNISVGKISGANYKISLTPKSPGSNGTQVIQFAVKNQDSSLQSSVSTSARYVSAKIESYENLVNPVFLGLTPLQNLVKSFKNAVETIYSTPGEAPKIVVNESGQLQTIIINPLTDSSGKASTWGSDAIVRNVYTGETANLKGYTKFNGFIDGSTSGSVIKFADSEVAANNNNAIALEDLLTTNLVSGQNSMFSNIVRIETGAGNDIIDMTSDNNNYISQLPQSGLSFDGGADRDIIWGSKNSETFIGGLGADRMTGGGGADVFKYNSAAESTVSQYDVISDFDSLDTLNFTALGLTNKSTQVTLSQKASGVVNVNVDINSDGTSDMLIEVTGDVSLNQIIT